MSGNIVSFPFFPLARLRQVEGELQDNSLTYEQRMRLLALRSWCLQMIAQEKRTAN